LKEGSGQDDESTHPATLSVWGGGCLQGKAKKRTLRLGFGASENKRESVRQFSLSQAIHFPFFSFLPFLFSLLPLFFTYFSSLFFSFLLFSSLLPFIHFSVQHRR